MCRKKDSTADDAAVSAAGKQRKKYYTCDGTQLGAYRSPLAVVSQDCPQVDADRHRSSEIDLPSAAATCARRAAPCHLAGRVPRKLRLAERVEERLVHASFRAEQNPVYLRMSSKEP